MRRRLLLSPLVVAWIAWTLPSSSSFPSSDNVHVIELLPDTAFPSQRVLYNVPQLFRVVELQPATVYDIKVSYPATQPALFTLQIKGVVLPITAKELARPPLENNAQNNVPSPTKSAPRRRVLNTVKLRLDPYGVETHESVRFRLAASLETTREVEFSLLAKVEGVRRPDVKLGRDSCEFDIVVEQVLLEAFPRHTLVLMGWLLVLLLVTGVWVLPYLEKKLALTCVEDRKETTETKTS